MRLHKLITLALLVLVMQQLSAQTQRIATFDVQLPAATNGIDVPVSINLDDVTSVKESSLVLVEVIGKKAYPVPFQVKQDGQRTLSWLVHTKGNQQSVKTFSLLKGTPSAFARIAIKEEDGAATIHNGDQKLVNYHYKTVYPPAGIDTNYKRSGFIHPLWTPHGQELTRIQAPDHYHHYGLWNPWTHVLFEKDTVDFWNLKDHKGTVRFARFISETDGPIFSEFEALHEHVVFKKDGTEKVALNEIQTVRVYKPATNADYYIMDITSKLTCATQSPFHILAYRYAGLGWRTTGFWNNENCEVLTSEGKTRKDTDGSKARWCIVQGALENNDYGGAVMLSNPANYNYPEPMRIWTLNTNGRGDMFANFAPTKDMDWELEPGKTYVLKYRFVVFNGKFDKDKAESAWQYFANPAKATVLK
ncbi:MAG: PmoA family protein [Chitinophagaceae bacterium]